MTWFRPGFAGPFLLQHSIFHFVFCLFFFAAFYFAAPGSVRERTVAVSRNIASSQRRVPDAGNRSCSAMRASRDRARIFSRGGSEKVARRVRARN
jgi:hypothetical protein